MNKEIVITAALLFVAVIALLFFGTSSSSDDGFISNYSVVQVTSSFDSSSLSSFTENITTSEFLSGKNLVIQYHNTLDVDSVDTNWHNISWNLNVPAETTAGYSLSSDNQSVIFAEDGIYRVQGCIHSKNNGAGWSADDATLKARTIIAGVEARCLQASEMVSVAADGVGVLGYVGTIAVTAGDTLQVQWMTSDTDLDLEGDTAFDNPVSASVNLERISLR